MLLLLSAGCSLFGTKDESGDTGAPADSEDDTAFCVIEPEPPTARDTGAGPHVGATLSGSVTWTLAFDEAAEANGYTDCTYTRVYANVEVGTQGFLCPDCSLVTTGTAVMTDGYESCYLQIDDNEAEHVEHLGLGDVDGATHFFRASSENVSLRDMGPTDGAGPFTVTWSDEAELAPPTDTGDTGAPDTGVTGGVMILTAVGEMEQGTDETVLVPDVEGARTEPYTCGWPMNNPGGPNSDWELADGEIFPNLRLEDQCGEPMDLWDFRGYYLVIDSSAPNCGPCQSMAGSAEEFKALMAEECVPVELITLLNESLSAVNRPASLQTRLDWAEEFGLSSPVLADVGAGYALMPDYLGVEDGMSYPGIVVLDPEGRVLYGSTGFGDWEEIETQILDDWSGGP